MTRFDVDYPHVRNNADIVAVLAHYKVALIGEGDQRKALCPFHETDRPSLNVNVSRNVFKCHACGSGGNIIKLVQLLDPKLENPRRAALRVAELCGITAKPDGKPLESKVVAVKEAVAEGVDDAEEADDGVPFNRPLTFTLQLTSVVEGEETAANQFVEERGLSYDRLAELGIGMSTRGSMKDRLAIPIFNQNDEVVAYCGRDVGLITGADEPKYKFPPKFRKELELYGWDVAQYFDRVVLVESMLSVIKHGGVASKFGETGFGVVSTMGACISKQQLEMLAEAGPEVIISFDRDEEGQNAATQVAAQIAEAGLWVRVQGYSDGRRPHQDDTAEFCERYGIA